MSDPQLPQYPDSSDAKPSPQLPPQSGSSTPSSSSQQDAYRPAQPQPPYTQQNAYGTQQTGYSTPQQPGSYTPPLSSYGNAQQQPRPQQAPYASGQQSPYTSTPQTPYSQQNGYGSQQNGYNYDPCSTPDPYGQTQPNPYAGQPAYQNQKSSVGAALLAFFFGGFGIHNFCLGYTGRGIAQLLLTVMSVGFLAVVSWIWAIIEAIMILTASPGSPASFDANGIPLRR